MSTTANISYKNFNLIKSSDGYLSEVLPIIKTIYENIKNNKIFNETLDLKFKKNDNGLPSDYLYAINDDLSELKINKYDNVEYKLELNELILKINEIGMTKFLEYLEDEGFFLDVLSLNLNQYIDIYKNEVDLEILTNEYNFVKSFVKYIKCDGTMYENDLFEKDNDINLDR